MTDEAQEAWFEAAYRALAGVPVGLLRRGCLAAMRTADHHSKIVPAIIKAIDADWSWRRRMAAEERPTPALPSPPDPADEAERAEVGKLMRGLVRKLEARHVED